MTNTFYLTDDFNKASPLLASSLERMLSASNISLRADFYDNEVGNNTNNNCYNYVLNRKAPKRLQPGALSNNTLPDPRLTDDEDLFARAIHQNAQEDGLNYLGFSFSEKNFNKGDALAALFISRHKIGLSDGLTFSFDYHWCALKSSSKQNLALIWAHKIGRNKAELLGNEQNTEKLFEHMCRTKYGLFGGFYAIPEKLSL